MILYFVSLAVWFRFPQAKLTAGGERRVRILAIEFLFLFFSSGYARTDLTQSGAGIRLNSWNLISLQCERTL